MNKKDMNRKEAVLHASITLTAAAFAQQPVHAQEPVLAPVTVTAQPVAAETLPDIETARQRLSTIAGGANVVDAEQYKEGRVSTLEDALRFSPGVFIAPRFGAEEARLSIRGSGLQRTFHLRGVQVLQDGVPLNLADGSADFQAVEPLSARYVEVYRGANALQFGSATLGGAINFVSPSGLNAPPLAARVEAGSFGYRRAQVSAASKGDSTDWFVAGSHFAQEGFRRHAAQDTQRLSGNIGLVASERVETRFFLSAVHTDSQLPGALTKAEMEATPRKPNPGNVNNDQRRDFTLFRLSNLTSIELDAQRRIEVGGFYSQKSLFHPIFQVLNQDSHDYGVNVRYLGEGQLLGRRNILVAGIHASQGQLSDDRFENLGGRAGARTGESRQRSTNLTLFMENRHYLTPSTAVIAGAQAVQAQRKLQDRYLSNGDNSVDRRYSRLLPKIGVLHEAHPGMQLYGNVSGSYEPPTFGELAGGPNVTPVDAQRAITVEIGTRGEAKRAWGGIQWDVSLYRAALKKELLSLADANGNPLGTVNAANTIHQGVEAGAELKLGTAWILRANYQLNDFRFDNDPVYGNRRLAGVPRHVVVGEVLYTLPNGFYAGPNLRAASKTYVDHANTLHADGYAVVGFKLGQQLHKQLSWFVDARNLGDNVYAATTNVTVNANGMDSAQFYPGDGRSMYAGVEWRY
jgi:iron complex outermembrane receptor protein